MTTIAHATAAVAATSGQIKQINRLVADAVEKVISELGLDNPGAQRVIEHGDELIAAITEALTASLQDLSVTDKYKDEEVKSNHTYPKGFKVKSVADQLQVLCTALNLQGVEVGKLVELTEQPLPQHAEGYYVIQKWETVAPTYGEAVDKVLAAIAKQRKFYNYREGQTGPKYLRQTERSKAMFAKLGAQQPNPHFLVVPAQFGLRHRGRSVRRAREVFLENEFGLGAFAVACMILTHLERFTKYEDLCVDCSGDEASPGAVGDFSFAPYFGWSDGGVEFGFRWTCLAYDYFGTVSGFVSQ
jgi:hypothetical protein